MGFHPFTSYLERWYPERCPWEEGGKPEPGVRTDRRRAPALMHLKVTTPYRAQTFLSRVDGGGIHPGHYTRHWTSCHSAPWQPRHWGLEPLEHLGGREHRPRRPWGPTRALSGPPPNSWETSDPLVSHVSAPASEGLVCISPADTSQDYPGPSPSSSFLMAPGTRPKAGFISDQFLKQPLQLPDLSCLLSPQFCLLGPGVSIWEDQNAGRAGSPPPPQGPAHPHPAG